MAQEFLGRPGLARRRRSGVRGPQGFRGGASLVLGEGTVGVSGFGASLASGSGASGVSRFGASPVSGSSTSRASVRGASG